MCRALIWHEYVKDVIDERGDCERIDRLQRDLQASFCHSTSLVRAHFVRCQAGRLGTSSRGSPLCSRQAVGKCGEAEFELIFASHCAEFVVYRGGEWEVPRR